MSDYAHSASLHIRNPAPFDDIIVVEQFFTDPRNSAMMSPCWLVSDLCLEGRKGEMQEDDRFGKELFGPRYSLSRQ